MQQAPPIDPTLSASAVTPADERAPRVAVARMQGSRDHMEDRHLALVPLAPLESTHWLSAVFDGHGGAETSEFLERRLVSALLQTPAWSSYVQLQTATENNNDAAQTLLLAQTLRETVARLDMTLCRGGTMTTRIGESGSTLCVVVIAPTCILTANVGDSRAVVVRDATSGGAPPRMVLSTIDHKPGIWAERTRIERSGGYVAYGRVNGMLAMSRSMGDTVYKYPRVFRTLVISTPDVETVRRRPGETYHVLLGSDGVWDAFPAPAKVSAEQYPAPHSGDATSPARWTRAAAAIYASSLHAANVWNAVVSASASASGSGSSTAVATEFLTACAQRVARAQRDNATILLVHVPPVVAV